MTPTQEKINRNSNLLIFAIEDVLKEFQTVEQKVERLYAMKEDLVNEISKIQSEAKLEAQKELIDELYNYFANKFPNDMLYLDGKKTAVYNLDFGSIHCHLIAKLDEIKKQRGL